MLFRSGNDAWQACWDNVSTERATNEGYNEDGYRGGVSPDGRTHSSGGRKIGN